MCALLFFKSFHLPRRQCNFLSVTTILASLRHPFRNLEVVEKMSTAPKETETKPAPWYAAFPEPQSDLMNISRAEVLEMLKGSTGEVIGKDFVLVDLRRNDFEGGTIRGSINLPAQSLYPTLPTVYAMFKAAGLKKVIFYCGSSTGRGSRGARWLSDYLLKVGDESIQSLALFEGIKGWANAGPEYVEWMEGYDASVWERLKSQ